MRDSQRNLTEVAELSGFNPNYANAFFELSFFFVRDQLTDSAKEAKEKTLSIPWASQICDNAIVIGRISTAQGNMGKGKTLAGFGIRFGFPWLWHHL